MYSVRERKCWCVLGCAAPVGDDLPILRIAEAYKVPRARVFIPEIRHRLAYIISFALAVTECFPNVSCALLKLDGFPRLLCSCLRGVRGCAKLFQLNLEDF